MGKARELTKVERGALLTLAVAAVVVFWGFRTRGESFVLYAAVYAVIAVDVFLVDAIPTQAAKLLIVIASTIGTIVAAIVKITMGTPTMNRVKSAAFAPPATSPNWSA